MMPMFVAILRRLCDDYIFIVTILRTRILRTGTDNMILVKISLGKTQHSRCTS